MVVFFFFTLLLDDMNGEIIEVPCECKVSDIHFLVGATL